MHPRLVKSIPKIRLPFAGRDDPKRSIIAEKGGFDLDKEGLTDITRDILVEARHGSAHAELSAACRHPVRLEVGVLCSR